MKTITVYEATDGKRFATPSACEKYEADGCVEFEPLPDYGDHLPLTVDNLRWMISGDGSAYYATADKRSRISIHATRHPAWATHLIYFGK